MRILFVTRKFPPSVGGMENAAAALHAALSGSHRVHLIKWGGSNRWLPLIYPWLAMRTLAACWLRRPDVVYLQDGLLAPIGTLVRVAGRKPTVLTVHGLEVTYANRLYRRTVLPQIARQTRVVAVSEATAEAVGAATGRDDIAVVNNGVADEHHRERASELLPQLLTASGHQVAIAGRPLLYTAGRLVARKGIAWFASAVLPAVAAKHPDVLFLVSGTGEQQDAVAALAAESPHMAYLGRVEDDLRDALYTAADLFIMANQPIDGDMEGFGLVATEASSCGTPVVASRLEGITDAVIEGGNGFLIEAGDASGFASRVISELDAPSLQPAAVRRFTLERFSWAAAAAAYGEVFASARLRP